MNIWLHFWKSSLGFLCNTVLFNFSSNLFILSKNNGHILLALKVSNHNTTVFTKGLNMSTQLKSPWRSNIWVPRTSRNEERTDSRINNRSDLDIFSICKPWDSKPFSGRHGVGKVLPARRAQLSYRPLVFINFRHEVVHVPATLMVIGKFFFIFV